MKFTMTVLMLMRDRKSITYFYKFLIFVKNILPTKMKWGEGEAV